jgi:hypothetical protein
MDNTSVFGRFRTRAESTAAIEALRFAGYQKTEISMPLAEDLGAKDYARGATADTAEVIPIAGGFGALAGAALGWMSGMGIFSIPGLGEHLAVGPILAALAGIGAGVIAGEGIGFLIGLGMPKSQPTPYAGSMGRRSMVLAVYCNNSDQIVRAKEIIKSAGGEEIASISHCYADFGSTGRPMSPAARQYRDVRSRPEIPHSLRLSRLAGGGLE